MTPSELAWMRRALELAERGRGFVEPNPLVGAVVVQEDRIVGEGWHQRYGEAHAEVNALRAAGESVRGATLYVTLEPCCHFRKTPPCTDAIHAAGIGRVVAAMRDPFPEVASKGHAALEARGIRVEIGLGEIEARRLNAPYLKLLQTGRPHVHAKWAMSLDGKIATDRGDSRWISNEEARRRGHLLRGRMDAIVVGIGTVLADDPQLTSRPPGPRTATRIVLDSHGRLPTDSVLARTAREVPVLVVTTERVPDEHASELGSLGCEILRLSWENRRLGVLALLDELGRRRMTNILVEGGGSVLGSFFDARAVDEVHVFVAPRIIGGAYATSPVAGQGVAMIADSLALAEWDTEMVGDNILIHGRPVT